jgi:hypothetical protein
MGIITLILSLLIGFLTLAPTSRVSSVAEVSAVAVTVTPDTSMIEVTAEPTVEVPVTLTPAETRIAPVEATPDYSGSAPYLSEIYTLLDTGRGIFLPGEWKASAEEQDSRTTLTYRSASDSSLVYLEYLHFPGMTRSFRVPDYITPSYFDVVLSTFPDHAKVAECSQDGLYLYEFSGSYNSATYDIRYWARIVAPQRMLTVSMNFERGAEDLDHYAQAMFPTLPVCPS